MIVRCGNPASTSHGYRATVRVNGEIVTGVVLADAERGIVYLLQKAPSSPQHFQFPRANLPLAHLDEATGDYALTSLTGQVEIELPPRAQAHSPRNSIPSTLIDTESDTSHG